MTRNGRAVALAAVVLLSTGGCGIPGLSSPGSSKPSSGAGQLQLPQNTVFQGGAAPSPTPVPNGSPIRTPLAALPSLPYSTVTPRSTMSLLAAQCTGHLQQGVRDGLTVVPGVGSASVTWWNVGDPAVQSYHLAAVSQAYVYGVQPPWKWLTVAAGKGCGQVTATMSGLLSKKPYVFVLHAVVKNYENVPPVEPEIARSSPVMTL